MAYEPYLPATDMPRFLRELAEFVGLDDGEVAAIRRTAPLVLARESALTAALYEHFLKFPASARFFLGEDGEPDRTRIERRRHSLARWLRETAEAALTHEHAYYLLSIGLSHSHRAQGPGGVVPAHFVVGAMSLTQTALAEAFAAELPPAEALAASRAWNKLLLVHLAALLLGYLPPRPS
ncbi:MAG TPA: protoglobin domain-containing protein [Methylomirabilota bacterium]